MPEPEVVQRMREFRAEVQVRDSDQQNAMVGRWNETYRTLEAGIHSTLQEIHRRQANGEVFGTHAGVYSRLERYQKLMEQVSTELNRYGVDTEAMVHTAIEEAVLAGVVHSTNAMVSAAEGVNASFNRLRPDVVENMVGALQANAPVGSLLARAWPGATQQLASELMTGVALGYNPKKTARNMLTHLTSAALKRALLIARTEQARAYRTASLQNYRASSRVRGYQRLASKSLRTCLACLLHDGEFFELEVDFEEHPQGRCTMVPVLKGRDLHKWETGKEWFLKQSDPVQRKMMGDTKFALWKRGYMTLDQMVYRKEHPVWGSSYQIRSLKSLGGVSAFVPAGMHFLKTPAQKAAQKARAQARKMRAAGLVPPPPPYMGPSTAPIPVVVAPNPVVPSIPITSAASLTPAQIKAAAAKARKAARKARAAAAAMAPAPAPVPLTPPPAPIPTPVAPPAAPTPTVPSVSQAVKAAQAARRAARKAARAANAPGQPAPTRVSHGPPLGSLPPITPPPSTPPTPSAPSARALSPSSLNRGLPGTIVHNYESFLRQADLAGYSLDANGITEYINQIRTLSDSTPSGKKLDFHTWSIDNPNSAYVTIGRQRYYIDDETSAVLLAEHILSVATTIRTDLPTVLMEIHDGILFTTKDSIYTTSAMGVVNASSYDGVMTFYKPTKGLPATEMVNVLLHEVGHEIKRQFVTKVGPIDTTINAFISALGSTLSTDEFYADAVMQILTDPLKIDRRLGNWVSEQIFYLTQWKPPIKPPSAATQRKKNKKASEEYEFMNPTNAPPVQDTALDELDWERWKNFKRESEYLVGHTRMVGGYEVEPPLRLRTVELIEEIAGPAGEAFCKQSPQKTIKYQPVTEWNEVGDLGPNGIARKHRGTKTHQFTPTEANVEEVTKKPNFAKKATGQALYLVKKLLDHRTPSNRADYAGAMAIADSDFKSQHELGKSNGAYNPTKRKRTSAFGIGTTGGVNDIRDWEIYGYVDTKGVTASADSYGEVEFVFNADVRRRTTITSGNSLAYFDGHENVGTPMIDPTRHGITKDLTTLMAEAVKLKDPNKSQIQWDHLECQIQGGVEMSDVAEVKVHVKLYGADQLPAEALSVVKKMQKLKIPVRIIDDSALSVYIEEGVELPVSDAVINNLSKIVNKSSTPPPPPPPVDPFAKVKIIQTTSAPPKPTVVAVDPILELQRKLDDKDDRRSQRTIVEEFLKKSVHRVGGSTSVWSEPCRTEASPPGTNGVSDFESLDLGTMRIYYAPGRFDKVVDSITDWQDHLAKMTPEARKVMLNSGDIFISDRPAPIDADFQAKFGAKTKIVSSFSSGAFTTYSGMGLDWNNFAHQVSHATAEKIWGDYTPDADSEWNILRRQSKLKRPFGSSSESDDAAEIISVALGLRKASDDPVLSLAQSYLQRVANNPSGGSKLAETRPLQERRMIYEPSITEVNIRARLEERKVEWSKYKVKAVPTQKDPDLTETQPGTSGINGLLRRFAGIKGLKYLAAPAKWKSANTFIQAQITRVFPDMDQHEAISMATAAFKDLVSDKLPSTRCPKESLEMILDSGLFKSQHELSASTKVGPTKLDPYMRAKVGENGTGVPSYLARTSREHEFYGYIDTGITNDANYYGNIEFKFGESVRNRTTITFGDSYGGFRNEELVGVPLDNITHHGLRQPNQLKLIMEGKPARDAYVEAQIQGGVELCDVEEVLIHVYPDDTDIDVWVPQAVRSLEKYGLPYKVIKHEKRFMSKKEKM